MQESIKKEDIRVSKTRKMLLNAMSQLLKARNFNQITVNDLCKDALISRTTFYAHFLDKYDLLRCWLGSAVPQLPEEPSGYEHLECAVNAFVQTHKRSIRHLIEDADGETLALLQDWLLAWLPGDPGDPVLRSVYCGAVLHYLAWQVHNQFPPALPVMNPSLYRFLQSMQQLTRNP